MDFFLPLAVVTLLWLAALAIMYRAGTSWLVGALVVSLLVISLGVHEIMFLVAIPVATVCKYRKSSALRFYAWASATQVGVVGLMLSCFLPRYFERRQLRREYPAEVITQRLAYETRDGSHGWKPDDREEHHPEVLERTLAALPHAVRRQLEAHREGSEKRRLRADRLQTPTVPAVDPQFS